MDEVKVFDLVALLVDVPESGLRRGDVGTVIDIFEGNEHHPPGCLVEFTTDNGETQEELAITDPAKIMQLRFKLQAA